MSDVNHPGNCSSLSDPTRRAKLSLRNDLAPPVQLRTRAWQKLEYTVSERIEAFARSYFGDVTTEAMDVLPVSLADHPHAEPFIRPWLLYNWPIDGFPPAEWYLEKRQRRLSPDERSWLRAQLKAYPSILEVTQIVAGSHVSLRDRLHGSVVQVRDAQAADVFAVHDHLLARVVRYDSHDVLCGFHPEVLSKSEASFVIAECKQALRTGSSRVSKALLRESETGLLLIDTWQQTADARIESLPDMRLENGSGETLLLTTDFYQLSRDIRAEVEHFLCTLSSDGEGRRANDVQPAAWKKQPAQTYWLLCDPDSPASRSVLGEGLCTDTRFIVETNSVARADQLRGIVARRFGGSMPHVGRVHESVPPTSTECVSDSLTRTTPNTEVLWLKHRHYRKWLDMRLPLLGWRTPRDAVRRPDGRALVERLILAFEAREQLVPEPERMNFFVLRCALGLQDT